ncbi:MAG: Gfo/Idh/MocA family oxidoreductase [Deltaproteobacteria bacterium]|nr:Gfo/Idh/MocA family oxidoreductase [Candidatus Zymogenaceae bacterium]
MTSHKPFRLGTIGAGVFAEANLYPSLSLHFFDDVDRAAVCDLDITRAERMADKYGWKRTYTNFEQMVDSENLDGVIICLGGKHHPDVACRVLERGLPVFLEKPSSIYPADTERILEASKRAGKIVQVGHQKRHGLAYNRVREIIGDKKTFGNIIQIESKMHGFDVFPTFYTCMLEWQCHNLDAVISFGGDIAEVDAAAHLTGPNTGALVAMLKFTSNAVGTLAWGTYGGPGPFAERIEVLSDTGKGVIITNAREVTYYTPEAGEIWTSDWNPISPNQSHVFNGYVGEYRHFIDCARENREPTPSIRDEARTMSVLAQIAEKGGIPIEWGPVSSML